MVIGSMMRLSQEIFWWRQEGSDLIRDNIRSDKMALTAKTNADEKMVAALTVLMLHDRGLVSFDAPMAEYWPEFAAEGKEGVLVRHVLGHTAGLPVFDEPLDDLSMFDWEGCCRRLAGQAPRWTPGDGSGYHSETQGWLLGELVRRTDGRTLGTTRQASQRPLDGMQPGAPAPVLHSVSLCPS